MSQTTTEHSTAFAEGVSFDVDVASQWTEVTILTDAGWVDTALQKVAQLAYLPDNWDSYNSPAPTREALQQAVSMLAKIDDLERFLSAPQVMAAPGGGVAVEWSGAPRELEVEFLPDGSMEYLASVHGEPVADGSVRSVADLHQRLQWLLER